MVNYVKTTFRSLTWRIDSSSVWQVELSGCITVQSAWFSSPYALQHWNNPWPSSISECPHCLKLNSSTGEIIWSLLFKGNKVKNLSTAVPTLVGCSSAVSERLARLFMMGRTSVLFNFGIHEPPSLQFHHNESVIFTITGLLGKYSTLKGYVLVFFDWGDFYSFG